MSYESPWGVMSTNDQPTTPPPTVLRIPMRGYETKKGWLVTPTNHVTNPHEGLWDSRWYSKMASSNGYESPWGVMRRTLSGFSSIMNWLRIPMRGYETVWRTAMVMACLVTNPHEGLWVGNYQRLAHCPNSYESLWWLFIFRFKNMRWWCARGKAVHPAMGRTALHTSWVMERILLPHSLNELAIYGEYSTVYYTICNNL